MSRLCLLIFSSDIIRGKQIFNRLIINQQFIDLKNLNSPILLSPHRDPLDNRVKHIDDSAFEQPLRNARLAVIQREDALFSAFGLEDKLVGDMAPFRAVPDNLADQRLAPVLAFGQPGQGHWGVLFALGHSL
jgi:hypothetical protein